MTLPTTHYRVSDIKVGGFAVSSADPGGPLMVKVKDMALSDSPTFYVYAEQISRVILSKIDNPTLRDSLNRYLVVIHPDQTADIHIGDFNTFAKVKPNRDIQAGEAVYAKDITEISEVTFPDIQINPDDRVVFLERGGWRFGIYFDFTGSIDLAVFGKDIANLKKQLLLEDILARILADPNLQADNFAAWVVTEGKTDAMHLQRAFAQNKYPRVLGYPDLGSDTMNDLGDSSLLGLCRRVALMPPQKMPIIFVFDRDNPETAKALQKQAGGTDSDFQSWGGNVFSMMIPRPPDRTGHENISIEMYYPDEVITRALSDGKRLHFSNELKWEGGRATVVPADVTKEKLKKVYGKHVEAIQDGTGKGVAISKTVFAEGIYKQEPPFDKNVSFENFRLISDIFEKIIGK